MAKVWITQDGREKKKKGSRNAPWYINWIDPDGKRRQRVVGGMTVAKNARDKLAAELTSGLYKPTTTKPWPEFVAEYNQDCKVRLRPTSARTIADGLATFTRIAQPRTVAGVKVMTIDAFVRQRLTEKGRKPGQLLSPYSVNRELSGLRAALSKAVDWEYIAVAPKIKLLKTDFRIGDVMTAEDFQKIVAACDTATVPVFQHVTPGVWWQALLTFGITTGWRISQILQLAKEDVNLEDGTLFGRASTGKHRRDGVDFLPEVTLGLVKQVVGFEEQVFAWPHDRRTLDKIFSRIQAAAGTKLPCRIEREHEHTPACFLYSWHSLRRGFATMNASRMSAFDLQRKMRHKSLATTQGYVALADSLRRATQEVWTPPTAGRKQA